LAARGRLNPEVTSPVDTATAVFYSYFVYTYRLSCTVSTLLALILFENGEKTISAARAGACNAANEVIVRFLDSNLMWVSFGIVRLPFTVQKLFGFVDLHAKRPLKILGNGYPPKKVVIDETS
jgi:hypothetical protein